MDKPFGELSEDIAGSIINMSTIVQDADFFCALGALVSHFSVVEISTVYVLSCLAKADQVALKSIVYPLRVDNAITSMKRVISSKNLSAKRISELKQTLDHLAQINRIRNDILHLGIVPAENGDEEISNKQIAFEDAIRICTIISVEYLRQIDHDLLIISSLWARFVSFYDRRKHVAAYAMRPNEEAMK